MSAVIQFEEAAHRYHLDGRPVPSVTQILDPLQVWDGIPEEILEAARRFGSYVHHACHLLNEGRLDWASLDPNVAACVEGYQKFLEESAFVVLASEERLGSTRWGVCGTLDLRGLMPKARGEGQGVHSIIDIKSSYAVPRTVGPQTAAYAAFHEESGGDKVRRRYCLQLKPGGYKLVPLTDPQDFTVFVSALNLWKWRNA